MNIVFTNPALWPLLAALAAPLLLHLFARVRPRTYPFPSAEFLLRIVRQTTRMKRPRDRWLLLLRTLLFAAIVILFLKPALHLSDGGAAPGAARHVIAIVDATASMAWVEGARTRFAAACAEATEALGGLTARDQANVIWLRARPVAVFPELGRNIPFLRQELRRAGVTYEPGDIPAALRMAIDMLEGTEGRREIHVLSDFQSATWSDIVFPEIKGVEWIRIPVGNEEAANTAVVRVATDPPQPLAGETFTLAAELRHYAATPRRLTAYLSLGEIQRSLEVQIPAWGETTLVFHERLDQAGDHPFEIRLDEDAFVADDRHYGIVSVRDGLRIGLYAGEETVARPWERVMQAVGWAKLFPLRDPDFARAIEADALLLAGWNGDGDGVWNYLRNGGAVVWQPAPETPGRRLSGAMETGGDATPLICEENPRQPWAVRLAAEDDSLFRIFQGGAFGDPARALFAARFRLPPSAPSVSETVLMAYEDGVPALTRRRWANGGTLYVWNLPLSPAHTAWTLHEEFVALFAELVLAERATQTPFPNLTPGDPLVWTPDREMLDEDVQVLTPQGEPRAVSSVSRNGRRFLAAGIAERPGHYSWRAHERPVFRATVNFPPSESDLRTLSPAELRSGKALTLSRGHTVRQLRDGIPLWPYVLLAALFLAITEGWTAWRFGLKS